MKLIENITQDEIRVNINRQANNVYDMIATFEAMQELQDNNQIVDAATVRAIDKMRQVLKRKDNIVQALQDKITLFETIVAEYDEKHGEQKEYGVSDMMAEAAGENETY